MLARFLLRISTLLLAAKQPAENHRNRKEHLTTAAMSKVSQTPRGY